MRSFLHIGFSEVDVTKLEEMEKVFNKAIDWARYADNCWIVYTSSSTGKWLTRLSPFCQNGEHVFIVNINKDDRSGLLPEWIWEWLDKRRLPEKLKTDH